MTIPSKAYIVKTYANFPCSYIPAEIVEVDLFE